MNNPRGRLHNVPIAWSARPVTMNYLFRRLRRWPQKNVPYSAGPVLRRTEEFNDCGTIVSLALRMAKWAQLGPPNRRILLSEALTLPSEPAPTPSFMCERFRASCTTVVCSRQISALPNRSELPFGGQTTQKCKQCSSRITIDIHSLITYRSNTVQSRATSPSGCGNRDIETKLFSVNVQERMSERSIGAPNRELSHKVFFSFLLMRLRIPLLWIPSGRTVAPRLDDHKEMILTVKDEPPAIADKPVAQFQLVASIRAKRKSHIKKNQNVPTWIFFLKTSPFLWLGAK